MRETAFPTNGYRHWYDYFPDWDDAPDVISRFVDAVFNGYEINDSHGRPYVTFTCNRTVARYGKLIPEGYRTAFWAIVDAFPRYFFDPPDTLGEFDVTLRRRINTHPASRTPWVDPIQDHWIMIQVERLMNHYAQRHGTTAAAFLKGMLGLPPYNHRIPVHVHQGVFNRVTLARLGISPDGGVADRVTSEFIFF